MIQTFLATGKVLEKSDLNYAKGSGLPFVNLQVGLTDTYSNASGNHVIVHKVKVFCYNKQAVLATTIKENDDIILELQLTTSEKEGKDGKKWTNLDVKLKNIVYINGKPAVMPLDVSKESNLNEEAPF